MVEELNERVLSNGSDGPYSLGPSLLGFGNTNPDATLGPTQGLKLPAVRDELEQESAWVQFERGFTRHRAAVEQESLWVQLEKGLERQRAPKGESPKTPEEKLLRAIFGAAERLHFIAEAKVAQKSPRLKPTGQIVLFHKIMQDWGFNDGEASTLLGFESASDIREIYLGMKPVGHRDANDRLRAVLRIAADLHALFRSEAAIRDWLSEPQRDLDRATPRSLLTEGSMENLLRVKYYVAYLSGR
jgi:hypothetical protein